MGRNSSSRQSGTSPAAGGKTKDKTGLTKAKADAGSAALKVVGWREWVVFPDFGGPMVRAKVDTGARTSAIHARNIKISVANGREFADFDIYPHQRDAQTILHCRAPIVARRRIRDSGGHVQERIIVRTPIQIGDASFEIDLSLTRRDQMGYRMLLGRRALKNRYVVDSGRSYVQGASHSGRKQRPDLRRVFTGSGKAVTGSNKGASHNATSRRGTK